MLGYFLLWSCLLFDNHIWCVLRECPSTVAVCATQTGKDLHGTALKLISWHGGFLTVSVERFPSWVAQGTEPEV